MPVSADAVVEPLLQVKLGSLAVNIIHLCYDDHHGKAYDFCLLVSLTALVDRPFGQLICHIGST